VTRALICLVATAFALALLLAYRVPDIPLAAPVDRAVASGPPKGATTPAVAAGRPRKTGWTVSDRGELEVVGPPVGWSYGHVQVRVTLKERRILDVAVVDMATTNPVSRYRSRAAVSRLRGEVLSGQDAGIDVVTGATYTSNAYLDSLQAALDMAHAATTAR
jgi:FMN-binding domain